MILFFDDDPKRHTKFKRNSIGHNVVYAFTIEEAIVCLLADCTYDKVYLDHDICGEEGQGRLDCPVDGRTLARWIAENKPASLSPKETKFILHSLNREGACEMGRILKDAGYRHVSLWPFAWKEPL